MTYLSFIISLVREGLKPLPSAARSLDWDEGKAARKES
jgi:hypothetical protein